jgi:hypothetical protein
VDRFRPCRQGLGRAASLTIVRRIGTGVVVLPT